MATNTRKLASLLGASGAGIANDGTLTSAAIGEVIVAGDIANDAVGTAELANDVTISTSGNIATTGSGTLTVAGTSALNGDVTMATNKKIKQKGAFMQSSTHQALTLGG